MPLKVRAQIKENVKPARRKFKKRTAVLFQLSPIQVAEIDKVAENIGQTRTAAVRSLLQYALDAIRKGK